MSMPQRPRDVQLTNIIDKLAEFVARNGPDFEQMTKIKQQNNSKFSFLQNGSEFFQYYQYRVMEERRNLIGMIRTLAIVKYIKFMCFQECLINLKTLFSKGNNRIYGLRPPHNLKMLLTLQPKSTLLMLNKWSSVNKSCNRKRTFRLSIRFVICTHILLILKTLTLFGPSKIYIFLHRRLSKYLFCIRFFDNFAEKIMIIRCLSQQPRTLKGFVWATEESDWRSNHASGSRAYQPMCSRKPNSTEWTWRYSATHHWFVHER